MPIPLFRPVDYADAAISLILRQRFRRGDMLPLSPLMPALFIAPCHAMRHGDMSLRDAVCFECRHEVHAR